MKLQDAIKCTKPIKGNNKEFTDGKSLLHYISFMALSDEVMERYILVDYQEIKPRYPITEEEMHDLVKTCELEKVNKIIKTVKIRGEV